MDIDFLSSRMAQPWTSDRTGAECEFYYGEGNSPLEVVVTERDDRPRKEWLVRTYKDRRGQRVSPVLLVVLRDGGGIADICGPVGEEDPPVKRDLDPDQIRRIADTALDEPDRFAAQRFLDEVLEQIDDELVGLRNQGLLSTHELKVGVPDRSDWSTAAEHGQDVLDEAGRDLVEELGYSFERLTDQSYVLKDTSDGRETAVAVFLEDDESFDHAQDRFTGQTPVSYALNEADKKNLEYVLANNDGTLRLYTTNPDAGFGSRGRTDTFVEVNTDLLTEDNAAYLWLLFSAPALREEGSLQEIMADSKDYAAALGERLRERIYEDAIPDLAEAIAQERDLEELTKEQLDETYEMTLVQLYRLLFIAYAEDEGFLPRHNPRYDKRSLKQKAHELHDLVEEGVEFDEDATDHWDDVMRLTEAIHDGRNSLSLPAYDGRLLSSEEDVFEAGGKLAKIELTDDQFGPVLANLLIDETEDGYEGPVDFRNIGVREFGVIYEGLLESELSLADQDLTVDDEGHYVPVETDGQQTLGDEEVEVSEGEVYLHGQSGERKATGTYYTKTRFVEHLLDHSLEPALEEHVERLERLAEEEDEHAVADAFFDIRLADIAMGSGHFLVGAVDRIERALMTFISQHDVTPVEQELDRLREEAQNAFESSEEMPEVERSQLLRRQVARRCVFGVDLNPLATELARLSIWVHTFVPGLPLTFLDYNLTTGDSLAGIGTLDEVTEILDAEQKSLDAFLDDGSDVMEDLESAIEAYGRLADADAEQVEEARNTRHKIEQQLEQPRAAFDILAASRIDDDIDPEVVEDEVDLTESDEYEQAQEVLKSINPLHFPASFPEVFMGDDSGFDVIVGNPPWEEATLEENEFWSRYIPGLQAKSQPEQEDLKEQMREDRTDLVEAYEEELEEQQIRSSLLRQGPYPGVGGGGSAPDTYIAFSWRFWSLINAGGKVGVVLPRTAFSASTSEEFRRELFEKARIIELTFLVNNRRWIFSDVHPQYTIALVSFEKVEPHDETVLPMRGPFPDLESYQEGVDREPHRFRVNEAMEWTGNAALPLLPPLPGSTDVFERLVNNHPRLSYEGSWKATPASELNAGSEKTTDDGTKLMHFVEDPPDHFWPICKGATFKHWNPDTGVRYAWGDPDVVTEYLQEQREGSYEYAGSRSPFSDMTEDWVYDEDTLPCYHPRIVFRDVARATDSRTMYAALAPPNVFLTDKAPYLVWPKGNEQDEAYLLGVLSSIPLDWYTRRFVETSMSFQIFRSLPIPRPGQDNSVRQRVVEISGRLAAVDDRYADWADAVGVEYGPLDEDEKQDMIHELDAVVAHLYGLTREHLQVVFETFHDGWDHEPRMNAVLEHYDELAGRLDSTHHEHLDT